MYRYQVQNAIHYILLKEMSTIEKKSPTAILKVPSPLLHSRGTPEKTWPGKQYVAATISITCLVVTHIKRSIKFKFGKN